MPEPSDSELSALRADTSSHRTAAEPRSKPPTLPLSWTVIWGVLWGDGATAVGVSASQEHHHFHVKAREELEL
jgi:hypothetical protein